MQIHRLSDGENVYTVAEDYSISPLKLATVNEVEMNGSLGVGKELVIPSSTRTYTVRAGDELGAICRRFSINEGEIQAMNPELYGRKRLYQGQLLTVKRGVCKYGMALTNGYYYRGCPRSRFELFLPFINYLTICSARIEGNSIIPLFDDAEILDTAAKRGKFPLLRIYIGMCCEGENKDELISLAVALAKAKGYRGITLANISALGKDHTGFIEKMKKKAEKENLVLLTEHDLYEMTELCGIPNGYILTMEKLHKTPVPPFDECERKALCTLEESSDITRASIDLSAFAYSEGKYIDKNSAIKDIDRQRREYLYDDKTKTLTASGRGKKDILLESLENTKAKLTLVGELGYMGISFDIARTPLNELILYTEAFNTPDRNIYLDEEGKCPGVS